MRPGRWTGVLDLLHTVKAETDGTLTFRRSCARSICGSDAMRIDGRNCLAYKPGRRAGLEDLASRAAARKPAVGRRPRGRHGRLLRQDRQRQALPRQRQPGADPRAAPTGRARARYDDTTKCILCAACTTSCPSFWAQKSYVGPAAIVQAHRFIFDSRDEAADERLEILADKDGVWRCRTIFNCTDACPRGINITQAILEVSGAIVAKRV